MNVTITDPREIAIKSRYIRELRTMDELHEWKRAVRQNGGERFPGESNLLIEVEARISIEGGKK